ncbi:MAG: aminopeptidase P family protein [Lachnospiraceae bacterium]|nr:aminopeptidase P family protein [Lachnospiraceae bacterium]MBF1040245.1 aminopeptidase P family protein [Lachnospiraceae bacterium]
MNQMIMDRLKELRSKMAENGIDYYMMPTSDYHNSEYSADFFKVREFFSNFSGSNGTLVVSANWAGLWTDGRYFIQAEREIDGTGVTLYRMLDKGVPTIKEYLSEQMQKGQCLGFDGLVNAADILVDFEETLKEKQITFRYDLDLAADIWKDRPALPCTKVYLLSDELCGRSFQEKLHEVRQQMKEAGAKTHFLSKLDDIMWLTNLRADDVECNPVALSYCLVTEDCFYLFLQKKALTPEVEAYAGKNGILLEDYHSVVDFLRTFHPDSDILYDQKNISYTLYRLLQDAAKRAGVSLIDQMNPTTLLKAVKNETELKNIREVYRRDSAVLTRFIYWLKQNVGKQEITEYSAATKLDHMRSEIPGFVELSFPTISAYGANAAMMHYEATKDKTATLKPEGMLLVDSGATYMGGTTDVTRTIVLGPISEEIKKHYTLSVMSMLRLANLIFLQGSNGVTLDLAAREPMWKNHMDYKCGTGHGIGYMLNVHEGPQRIAWRSAQGSVAAEIMDGMIVSDEPGVYKEGSHGIRIENILEVQKDLENSDGQFLKFGMLTYAPIDLEAIDPKYMQQEDIDHLNAYHQAVYDKVEPLIEEPEIKVWLKQATRAVG